MNDRVSFPFIEFTEFNHTLPLMNISNKSIWIISDHTKNNYNNTLTEIIKNLHFNSKLKTLIVFNLHAVSRYAIDNMQAFHFGYVFGFVNEGIMYGLIRFGFGLDY